MHIDIRYNAPEDYKQLEAILDQPVKDPVMIIGYHHLDENKKSLGFFITSYTNLTRNYDVEGTCVAKGKWFHPSIYEHLFKFVFDVLKCKRFTFRISKENKKSIALAEKAGCVLECELRGTDMLLYSILPEECKYYGNG